jgi:hypothetical protein
MADTVSTIDTVSTGAGRLSAVEILACGHVAHPGAAKACAHLARPAGRAEKDDAEEHVRLLTGHRLDYDLACTGCDGSGREIELVTICEGWAERFADGDELVAWRGRPWTEERPEPVDVTVREWRQRARFRADRAASRHRRVGRRDRRSAAPPALRAAYDA